jgi:glycosyltransferase involved in cell wall biosynthesis
LGDKIPISVAIITHNEERNIRDALESVRDFDDIIVVDSFSEDRTVERCRQYTNRVYSQEWQGFSRQKQRAVDYAKNEWVLILDADERVTPDLKLEMIHAIATGSHAGFYIPRKNFFLDRWIRHSGWWPDHTLRLFRKDLAHVEPREVHEKVIVSGSTALFENPLLHFTYRTIGEYMKKMEKYSELSAEELRKKSGILSALKLFINPLLVFLKMYILRLGFMDGAHGFILAVLYAVQTFLKYSKALKKKIIGSKTSGKP